MKCSFCGARDTICGDLMEAHACDLFRAFVDSGEAEAADTDYVEEDGRRPGFDEWALSLAVTVAERSRDPSTKVGAVIIRPDKTICSLGYNGFPRNMEDRAEWYEDRTQKYARVIHAEMNAILNAPEPVRGMTLYVTHPTCEHCAKHIAAAGITRVVWGTDEGIRERFNIEQATMILQDCGVQIREIDYGRNDNNASTGGEGAEASTREAGGKQRGAGNT